MFKGALQWSVYPQRTGSIYRRLWQPLQSDPCVLELILPTPEGWKADSTLAGKKVTQIFNPRPGRESNLGPQDWEAEILTTAPTPPLYKGGNMWHQIIYFKTPCGFKGSILPEVIYWETLYSYKSYWLETNICSRNMLEALAMQ